MSRSVVSRKPLVKSSGIRVKPMQRSIVLYNSAIKSEQTKKTYTFVLNKFREYFIIKDYDSLVSIGSKKIQVMIEDYVLYLRSKNSSYGWLNYGLVAENFRKSGWIVKDKGERESNYGTIRYILSHAGVKKGFHSLTWFGDLSYSNLSMPKYESEFLNCPYCSEKMKLIVTRDGSLGEPPPQQMECLVDLCDWFIPEYPQFLR